MAKIYSVGEIESIAKEHRARGDFFEYYDGAEYYGQLPKFFGWGYGREIEFRPGLWLSVGEYKKSLTHRCGFHHDPIRPLSLRFYLNGYSALINEAFDEKKFETAGHSYCYCLPNTKEIEIYPGKELVSSVMVRVSLDLLATFCDRRQELPEKIQAAIAHPKQARFYYENRITPPQQQILQQIMQWPYRGITRKLYLEGKVLELLALYFDQLLTPIADNPRPLVTRDLDRVYQARDILIQHMADPPSLSELAKQVQLNERKLKEGFRAVFDNTVFGYLYDHRMEQAKKLLETGQLNIQETARVVGYASRSSFVVAFKKKFDLPPSQYLKRVS